MVRAARFNFLVLAIFSCLAAWPGCTPFDQPYEPVDIAAQQAYFPLETSRFVEYRVDSVVYDFAPGGGTVRDSTSTFVREAIVDSFQEASGQLLYRIERFERADEQEAWRLTQVLAAGRNATQAIRLENNRRFLKLVFPFDRFTSWDGNLWIDTYQEVEIAGERIRPFVNWRYRVDSLDVAAVVGAFAFDSVLVVREVDETNAIERRLSRSIYAKNIGLVQREQWILDSQYCNQVPPPTDCLSKPWEEKAEIGYILRQVLIRHN